MLYAKSTGGFYLREIHGDKTPNDAVEITDEAYRALLNGQSEGKVIRGDDEGFPFLGEPDNPTADEIRRQRDALLEKTDWTQLADVPQSIKERWEPYRQLLRDIPQQPGFPETITWPQE